MTDTDLAAVCRRVEELERANRRGKWIMCALVLTMAGLAVFSHPRWPVALAESRTVEAEKFIVRDSSGKIRAALGWDSKAGAYLDLLESGGERVLSLLVGSNDKPRLYLYGGRGNVSLSIDQDGMPSINLSDKEKYSRLVAELNLDGSPSLSLRNSKMEQRIALNVDNEGQPSISLRDGEGINRAVIGCVSIETSKTGSVEKLPPSSITLFDKSKKVIYRAPKE